MSDEQFDERGDADIRRRAAWLLAMLVIVAVLFVALMVTFFNSSSTKKSGPAADIGGPASSSARSTRTSSTPRVAAPSRSAASTHPRGRNSSGSTSSSGRRGPSSCPTRSACVVEGDVGNVVAAINAYRRSHGVGAASGAVVNTSQTCAVTNGDNCPSAFFWEPVESRDGGQVVDKIVTGGGKGSSFLLDSQVKSFDVGWAFIPSTKSYACAVVAR